VFSQTAEYALRAMSWLALSPGVLVPTGELARATKVPPHYLAKVLQQMAAANLITGRRGVGGGYKLARPPSEISLREIVAVVTNLDRIRACPLGLTTRCESLCPLHSLMDSLAATVISALDGKTLADLLQRPGHPTPLCDLAAAGVGAVVSMSISAKESDAAKR